MLFVCAFVIGVILLGKPVCERETRDVLAGNVVTSSPGLYLHPVCTCTPPVQFVTDVPGPH